MDVTSQLNLEREAGMGENTERQPVEPESVCGCIFGGQAPAGAAKGCPLPAPGEDKALTGFCPAAVASLASLSTTSADSGSAPPAPPNTDSFFSPGGWGERKKIEKKRNKHTPKTTNRKQQDNKINESLAF